MGEGVRDFAGNSHFKSILAPSCRCPTGQGISCAAVIPLWKSFRVGDQPLASGITWGPNSYAAGIEVGDQQLEHLGPDYTQRLARCCGLWSDSQGWEAARGAFAAAEPEGKRVGLHQSKAGAKPLGLVWAYGGCGSKSSRGCVGFGPCFHLPGFHCGTLWYRVFLSHSHMVQRLESAWLSKKARLQCVGRPTVGRWWRGWHTPFAWRGMGQRWLQHQSLASSSPTVGQSASSVLIGRPMLTRRGLSRAC